MDPKLKERTEKMISDNLNNIFKDPINIESEVPDYLEYIQQPICFSDVLKKTVEDRRYTRQWASQQKRLANGIGFYT